MTLRNALPGIVAALALLAGCRPAGDDPAPPVATISPDGAAGPVLPIAEPPLDREAVLLAIARAASAAASGADDREAQRALHGKRFEVRFRFGCGQDVSEGPRRWSFDEQRRVLRIEVEPELSLATPIVAAIAGDDAEAAEGFWIRRPWLLTAACPVAGAVDETPAVADADDAEVAAIAPPPPRVAIAQIFGKADSRTHRRDNRALSATITLAPGELPGVQGFDLEVAGRARRLADGRVIACRATGTNQPPECLMSVEFDSMRLRRAGRGEVIAEWTSASPR